MIGPRRGVHRPLRRPLPSLVLFLACAAFPPLCAAQVADSAAVVAGDSTGSGSPEGALAIEPAPALAESLRAAGLENLTAVTRSGINLGVEGEARTLGPEVIYENRRYRHSATALGRVSRATGGSALAFERRLGLVSAAIEIPADGSVPSQVSYPSDGGFPRPPTGPILASTRRSLDLVMGPLFTYELPRLFDPTLIRVELQPELRYNPWPGGRARLAIVIPVRNDFDADSTHPDLDRVRPGPMMFEQYGWSPGAALVSACGGLFGFNRYGMSFGIARPLRGGEILLDSQADVTGFFAASDSGLTYSSLGRWTGFVGVSYRPPGLDVNVRLRAAKFLESDQGFELEVRRTMGDVEVAFDLQRVRVEATGGLPSTTVKNGIVRFTVPFPPLDRPVGHALRVLPVERFTFNYREESEPIGVMVANLASREDFLRDLDRSAIGSSAPRYQAARVGQDYRHRDERAHWVSMIGMTGFINTPWAGVIGDKELEVGYNKVPKQAAYQYRDVHSNELYYVTLGFLPHFEAGLRWTVMPGARPFFDIVPESHYVDRDRMFSGRVEILEARRNRPGLAIGIEDIHGSRRFHSSYAVVGMPFDISRLQNRVTLGYAPQVLRAQHRVLDGLFGACEVSGWRRVVTAVEHDSEKLNASLGIDLGFGLRARTALMDLKHLGVGAGWFRAL